MKKEIKKILFPAAYLLFSLVCGIFWLGLGAEREFMFCVWYVGTILFWLVLWVKVLDMIGKGQKLKRRERRKRKW